MAATFTKTGNKASVAAKLDKTVFSADIKNHELLKQAYLAYLNKGRSNLAVTKTRGLVRGGGRKPWRQKGTGRARFGSSRNPIWRGGGITFGPTGEENYVQKLSVQAKRQAIRQALSLAAASNKVMVLEAFENKDGKTKSAVSLLTKIGATKSTLLVVGKKDETIDRITRNIPTLKVVQASYINVFDAMNADHIIITNEALNMIKEWLGKTASPRQASTKVAKKAVPRG